MSIFRSEKQHHTLDDIASVVILEQTQQYKSKTDWGMTFDDKGSLNGSVIAMDGGQVPIGILTTFSVTYRDGEQEIVKEHSGTERCDRLLQLALDPPGNLKAKQALPPSQKDQPFELGKNQLPTGSYLIGREIPAGTYDFSWVFGSGTLIKYKNDHDTTLGATTYFQYMGNRHDYEYRQCLHVACLEGENLEVKGNLVVQIARSKEVEIDL